MVSVADKFGFLPGFGWIATQWTPYGPLNSFITVFICWMIAPGSVWAAQYFIEGRPVSLRAQDNFASFFPGDLYLGAMAGFVIGLGMAVLPDQEAWYTSATWHKSALAFWMVLSLVLTYLDVHDVRKQHGPDYPLWQILTPAKLVHNLMLYGPYAYLISTSIVAVAAGATWTWLTVASFVAALACGLVWVMLLMKESTFAGQLRLDKLVGAGKTKEELAKLTLPYAWRPIFLGRPRRKARHRAPRRRKANLR